MLRFAITARMLTSSISNELVDPLLDELLEHARRHGLTLLEANAFALRAKRAVRSGANEIAVEDLAVALAMLDSEPIASGSAPAEQPTNQQRQHIEGLLSAVLVDTTLALTDLGMFEVADEVTAFPASERPGSRTDTIPTFSRSSDIKRTSSQCLSIRPG